MANLLSNLGDLSVHRLLMGSHDLKLGVKLVDGRSQYLIGFGLGRCVIMFSKWAMDG